MVIVRPEAQADIQSARDWYEEQQPNLGQAFIHELDRVFIKLAANPQLYAKAEGEVRRALCRKFPFAVYFLESGNDQVVMAVLHQRREPAAWQSRQS